MYPTRTLIAAGVLAFLLSLALLAPARYLLLLAPEATANRISQATGTLWQGQARIASSKGVFNVSWDSHPWQLLIGSVALDWTLHGQALTASGALRWALWGRRLEIADGELGASLLGRFAPEARATFDQPLRLQGLMLALAPDGTVRDAGGRLEWGPGTLTLRGRAEPLALPALRGMLRPVDGHLKVLIDGESEPGGLLASADIDPAGNQLHVVVTQRGARIAGAAPAAADNPDAAFFELRQPLRQ